MTPRRIESFRSIIYTFYHTHGRHDLEWRRIKKSQKNIDPYTIAVSEIMLQQTQVARVTEKYKIFLKAFPTLYDLAQAPLSAVLKLWSGLGYNRRAKFLKQMAENVVRERNGIFPKKVSELEALPGIGHYTARAIATFAFNQPHVFIETNIRTVFIHHFFPHANTVDDKALMLYIEATLDLIQPRLWYWALMDYGSFLKTTGNRVHRKSKHYTKQSTFKGSRREVRGMVIKILQGKPYTLSSLYKLIEKDKATTFSVLEDLMKEGFVKKIKNTYTIA